MSTNNIISGKRLLMKAFEHAANNFRYREGIKKIEKLLKVNPGLNSEEALCKLGMLYDHLAMRQKSTAGRIFYEKKALSLYHCALKINPDSYRATWGIGRVWWHRHSPKAIKYAKGAYRLRKKMEKNTGLYAQNVGLVYESLNDFKKTEYWLLKGLKENKQDFGSYLNLVVFYRYIKNFEKAKKYVTKLKELFEKENDNFKRTKWGLRILEVIKNADKPLPKVKKGGG